MSQILVEVAQCAKLHTRPCTALHMITIFTLDSVHPMDCAWSANCATADACFFHRTSLCTKLKYLYFCIGLSTHSIYSSFKSIGVDLHTLPHRFPNAVRPLWVKVHCNVLQCLTRQHQKGQRPLMGDNHWHFNRSTAATQHQRPSGQIGKGVPTYFRGWFNRR